MSLVKLLSVSKSIIGERQQRGRYKMVEQGLLPKFAPVGRPVSLAPSEPMPAQDRETGEFAAFRSSAKGEPSRAPRSSGTVEQPSLRVLAETSAPACVNAVTASTDFFRLRRNSTTRSAPGNSRPAASMQGELTLDAVKVVRNDLSDADFDVVSVEKEKPPMDATHRDPPSRKSELVGLTWSRLKARLFNPERARA